MSITPEVISRLNQIWSRLGRKEIGIPSQTEPPKKESSDFSKDEPTFIRTNFLPGWFDNEYSPKKK